MVNREPHKLRLLKEILKSLGSVLIAYSGGVDSTFLARVAKETLNGKVLAVTAVSPIYPQEEIEAAREMAKDLGVEQILIQTDNLSNKKFTDNPKDRCYYCKKELFLRLMNIAKEKNLNNVLDGSNFDDLGDFRPGFKAAEELRIRSPLKEAQLSKQDVRDLSRELNLSTWDKPSSTCLATRFPYGAKITEQELTKIAEGERFIRSLGFKQVRLRHHGELARIEVLKEEIPRILEKDTAQKVAEKLKSLGYTYVTADLEGYPMQPQRR